MAGGGPRRRSRDACRKRSRESEKEKERRGRKEGKEGGKEVRDPYLGLWVQPYLVSLITRFLYYLSQIPICIYPF